MEDHEIVAAFGHARLGGDQAAADLRVRLGFAGPIRMLMALAVSVKHRGAGGKLADETLERALVDILRQEQRQAVIVLGRVHERNRASEALVTRAGFTRIPGMHDALDPSLGYWRVLIEA